MLTFVICLVVVGVACAAVFRITFGDDDQRATAPKQRHREPPLVDPVHPAPGPEALVPGPDPTALDRGESPPPAAGVTVAPFDDEALDTAADETTELPTAPDTPPDEAPRAPDEGTETTVAVPGPAIGGDTVEVVPDSTAPLPDELVPATGSAPSAAFTTEDEIVVRLRPEARTNGTAPYPTPGPAELVPGFGATALPWAEAPVAPPRPSTDGSGEAPAPAPAPAPAADDGAAGTEPTAPVAATTTEPDTSAQPAIDDRTQPVPVTTASHTALLQEAPTPRPGVAAETTAVADHQASGDRISTVVVVDDGGGRRLRSGVALLLTVTLVGVLLAVAIGVAVALAVYALRSVITG